MHNLQFKQSLILKGFPRVEEMVNLHGPPLAQGISTHKGGAALYGFKMTSFPYLHIFNRAMMNLLPLDSYFEL